MLTTRIAATAAALLVASAGTAGAQTSPSGQDAVRSATSAYFDALATGNAQQLQAAVTSDFRQVGANGATRNANDVYGRSVSTTLEGTQPQGKLSVNDVVVTGASAADTADWQTYTYTFVAGRDQVVRRYSRHALILRYDASGAWRVAIDHVSIDNTYF